jgi:hypothetical protein
MRAAELMLEGYIQRRRKALAELALSTLLEIAPEHPRRGDYAIWVAEIDQEVAAHSKVEEVSTEVRLALAAGDLEAARRDLAALDPLDSDAASALASELEHTERSLATDASIEARKRRIEALLTAGEVNDAELEIEKLVDQDVPKVTLDFFRRRLADRRSALRSAAELLSLESVFDQHLRRRGWQSARDVARVVGEQFGDLDRASRMLAEIDRQETDERRSRSVQQGIAALEGFLSRGDRQQAELALRVLRGLSVEESVLEPFRRRLESL